jgi:NADH-quinone oxidoreductase subunit A
MYLNLLLLVSRDWGFGKDGSLVFFYSCFILIVVLAILGLSYFLSPQFRFSTEKSSSYECGFEPFGDARMSFDVHFYIIGILFI